MKIIDFSFPTPEENLACDEALLDLCENGLDGELLRFWEPSSYFVVLGYSSRAEREVRLDYCAGEGLPILRRTTGGGTVLQGPGCLNFSVILRIEKRPEIASITRANQFIMTRHKQALEPLLGSALEVRGITDLAIGRLKFSGNAQRRKRHHLLFHGSFLLDFNLDLIEEVLHIPARQPAYRENRTHKKFLTNLHLPPAPIKEALRQCWLAEGPFGDLPLNAIGQLVAEKYSAASWNLKF